MTEDLEKKNTQKNKHKRPWWKSGLRIVSRIVLVLLIFLVALIFFIRSPWGQDIIVGELTHFVESKTKTKVEIKKLFITFSGDVDLQGLYLEDKKGDTLIYSEQLKVGIPLWPIITGNPIAIDGLEWKGVRANIVQKDTLKGYNFQFLIDAFAGDTTATKQEVEEDNTNSESSKIAVGSIDFSDFKINFNDVPNGMKANLELGHLFLEGKNIDLKAMKFEVAEIALENTKVNYIQSKATSPPEDTTSSTLPYLGVDHLSLKNISAFYESVPDSMLADVSIAELALAVPQADLANQDIQVDYFKLNNSDLKFRMAAPQKTPSDSLSPETPEKPTPFVWPEWNVDVKSIALQNNHLHYQAGEKPAQHDEFNSNYIVLNDFNFKANDIALTKKESAKLALESLTFREASGLSLSNLSFSAALEPTSFSIDDLIVKTGNSSIDVDAQTQFPSLAQFIYIPENAQFQLQLKQFNVDLNDVFEFQPELKENEYLEKLARHPFSGQMKAEGEIAQIDLSELLVNWGKNTSITAHGKFKNITDPEELYTDIENFSFQSTKSDITTIIAEEDLGIAIPQTVLLESRLKGGLQDINTQTQLTLPEGKVKIDGILNQKNQLAFDAQIDVINLALGEILKNPAIGTVAFEMKANGEGNNINDLNAELVSDFSKLEYNGYDFSALQLEGQLENGDGNLTLNYKDDNLDLNLDSQLELDSVNPKVAVNLDLKGADLYAIGLTEDKIKAKVLMDAQFQGNATDFNFKTKISDGVAVVEEDAYHLGTIDLSASVAKDSTSMDIDSHFLNGKLRANAGLDKISTALQDQLKSYFTDSTTHADTIINPVELEMEMKLAETRIVTNFLVPDIRTMDTLKLNVDFNQKERALLVNFGLPYIDYADNTVDSLQLNLDATADAANFKFGFNQLHADPFQMNRTYFDGDLKNNLLSLHFHAYNGEKEIYVIKSEVAGKDSLLSVHLLPDKLILEEETWNIPEDNKISFKKQGIIAQNFVLSRNGESLEIGNNLIESQENNIGLGFSDFKLANLLALFNTQEHLAAGELNGEIVAVDPFNELRLLADLNINNLEALQAPLGELTLTAKSKTINNYDLNLDLKGDDVDLAVKGNYAMENENSELDFNIDLNRMGIKTIAQITDETLSDASGYISGKVAINGSINEPDYQGHLQFKEASFNVNQLNSKFLLANDKIDIDNEKITLNQFTIEDEQNNKFSLDGNILTNDFSDPEFDLKINAKNFQALNSTKKDNDVFYGVANFDMKGTIKGKTSFPVVDLDISINENTDFTYAIQSSQASIEKRDGIVEFVNKENPDNILTKTIDSTAIAMFGGIELHANLNIHKKATFNVIVDPQTGDNLKISGEGALDFNIARNGRTTLSGSYEINGGHYRLSLYNLVKREFEFEPGSTITWRGDPMDADLDVTAKYAIKTSASPLMASQTAGASDHVKNKYRQRLPFWVFLNVNGELNQPKLDFRMGMPEDARGAIDGTVYSRIRQLNNQEDALNKQVFSLLVLNKFYPNPGSDGSGGGTASIVRDNVNDALADQLNSYSDRLMGNSGVELNFGLESYTDYQGESAEQRTDLNVSAQKKLLNDRLIVEVGSTVNVQGEENPGEENSVVGNASIQYLLTEDGRWRLKGFRDSEYENVIDGQVYVNGISVIFQRQFNKLNDLFKSPAPPKEDQSGEEKNNDKAIENKEKSSVEKRNKEEQKDKN